MDKSYSLILDLIRFSAALLVVFHHAEYSQFNGEWLSPLASFGHDSVIVFFILSGFVISYTTENKEKNWHLYLKARFARIFSVTIPALFLTTIIAIAADADIIKSTEFNSGNVPWTLLLANGFLINQTTLSDGILTLNPPFWSMNYEAWYYLLFGIYIFTKGLPRKLIISITSLIAGIKIILLFPIWLAGSWLYNKQKMERQNIPLGCLLLFASFFIYGCIRYYNFDDLIYYKSALFFFGSTASAQDSLAFSKLFVRDYVVSIFILIAFHGAFLARRFIASIISNHQKIIKGGAAMSFTLYLFHYPLLIIFSIFIDNNLMLLILTLISCHFFSKINEQLLEKMRFLLKINTSIN